MIYRVTALNSKKWLFQLCIIYWKIFCCNSEMKKSKGLDSTKKLSEMMSIQIGFFIPHGHQMKKRLLLKFKVFSINKFYSKLLTSSKWYAVWRPSFWNCANLLLLQYPWQLELQINKTHRWNDILHLEIWKI